MAITKIQSNAFPASIDLSNIDLTLGANEVLTANIADSNITTAKIADTAIHTGKVADLAITHAKLHTDMDLTSKTVTLPSIASLTVSGHSSTQTLSASSYITVGSLVVNDPGSNYYSYNNRIGGNVALVGNLDVDGVVSVNGNSNITTTAAGSAGAILGYQAFSAGVLGNHDTADAWQWKWSVLGASGGGGTGLNTRFSLLRSVKSQATDLETLTVDSLGNVGIGTDSPDQKLVVGNNSTYHTIKIEGSNAHLAATLKLKHHGGGGRTGVDPEWNISRGSDETNFGSGVTAGISLGGLAFWNNTIGGGNVDAMRLKDSGDAIFGYNVGIGTSSPTNKLHVVGTAKIEGSTLDLNDAGTFTISQNTAASALILRTATLSYLRFDTNGANERMRIDSNGSVGIGTTFTSLFNSVGGSTKLAVTGSSASTDVLGNTDASIAIINTDTTANNTAGLHFARADTDDSPNYAGASIVTQFHDTQVTAQYPKASMNFLTSTAANTAPSLKMRITSAGGIEHTAPDGQNGEAYRTRYASGSSNVVKVNEAISTGANGNNDLWFRIIVPQNYYHDAINAGVLTVSAINLATHATGSGIFQKVICIGTNHNSSYNAAISTLINSKSEDSYYPWTNTLEFYRNNDNSSDALREVTYIKSRGSNYSNFLLNIDGWIRYGNRLTLTFLGTTAPSNITLIG